MLDCYEYVNADAIAQGLSPFKPLEVSVEAGRLMLKRIRQLADAGRTFALESTLSSKSFAPFLKQCKRRGYSIRFIYIWINSADLAVERVKQRVASGGHFVPDKTIRRRYKRSLDNFFQIYLPLADEWRFYDNSRDEVTLIAKKLPGEEVRIINDGLWSNINRKVLNGA